MGTATTKRKVKKKKKMSPFKKFLFGLLFALLAAIIIGTGYLFGTLGKINKEGLNKDNLGINQSEIDDYKSSKKITNIALFGVDTEDGGVGRSDSIMVATVDPVHKKLKVTSIMRDSYVYIDGYGDDKINHAYAYGGPELSINTINQNFGLNIEDYVTVNFSSLPVIIDTLGGIEVNITDEEIEYINKYISQINYLEGKNSPGIYTSGPQVLDGVQALSYSRIRYTAGGDYERTQRQRTVLDGLFSKITSTPITQYPSLLNKILPYVETSLSTSEILGLGTKVLGIGNNLEQDRFPRDEDAYGDNINGVSYIVFDRETVKTKMMDYIFDDIR